MKKKVVLLLVAMALMIYPVIRAYLVLQKLNIGGTGINYVEDAIVAYQLSIWLTWAVLTVISIYYKWTTGKNLFFLISLVYLLVACGLFGYFIQEMVNKFNLPSSFRDDYTLGVFTALQYFAVAAVLTFFLMAAVWWFTRRWHRR